MAVDTTGHLWIDYAGYENESGQALSGGYWVSKDGAVDGTYQEAQGFPFIVMNSHADSMGVCPLDSGGVYLVTYAWSPNGGPDHKGSGCRVRESQWKREFYVRRKHHRQKR